MPSVPIHFATREILWREAMRIQAYSRLTTNLLGKSHQRRFHSNPSSDEPLRVLFCGSDDFSAASLRALHKEQGQDKALIESIDVVSRPAKRVGRGLKNTREGNPL